MMLYETMRLSCRKPSRHTAFTSKTTLVRVAQTRKQRAYLFDCERAPLALPLAPRSRKAVCCRRRARRAQDNQTNTAILICVSEVVFLPGVSRSPSQLINYFQLPTLALLPTAGLVQWSVVEAACLASSDSSSCRSIHSFTA